MRLIGIESSIIWESPSENRVAFEAQIRDALNSAKEEVDVVVLPENFTSGFSMNLDSVDSWSNGLTLNWMKALCQELDIAIFGSVAFKLDDGTARNRGLFVTPAGEVNIYDKKHLFTLGREGENYIAGEDRIVIEFRDWKFLLQICYDLRFPVFSRNNPNDPYDAIIYVANWPKNRIHAWRTLLQARAIENQCYVLGVNRCGEDPSGNVYTGNSLGVNPWGEIASKGPGVNLYCDKDKLDEFRRKYPFLADGK